MSALPLSDALAGATIPVGLRTKTAEDRSSAQQAMAFERMLVGELTKVLADPDVVTGGNGASGATSMLLGQMPDVMADAISKGGGIGLAAALQPALEGKAR